jgi:hypothetical protein
VSPAFFAAVKGKERYGLERRLRSAVAPVVFGENFPLYISNQQNTRQNVSRSYKKLFFRELGSQRKRHVDSSSCSVVDGARAALRSFASRRLMRCRRAFE